MKELQNKSYEELVQLQQDGKITLVEFVEAQPELTDAWEEWIGHLRLVLLDIGDLIGIDLAVLQRNALSDLLHIRFGEGLVQRHLVNLLLLERRVRELAGQIAVVGEK